MMNEQKILTPELEARVHQAVDNFMQGYGCCQSVVAAFADLYGLDDEMAKRIGAGFGGGVGRMRMMCGAVSGIVVLVGLDCGQTEGDDREGKSACYKVVQDLLAKSKEQNGSIICGNSRLEGARESAVQLCGFSKNGRILQVSPLRSQSRECCKNLRRISDGEKIRIYSYEIPE